MTTSAHSDGVRTAWAGVAYVAIVFAAGFALGVARTLALVPQLGDTGAVIVELPVILAISWLASGWLVSRFAVPPAAGHRLAMGLVAFALLMAAEAALSTIAFGRSLGEHLALYRQLPHLIGLAGQIVFALIPWLQTTR